MRTRRSAPVFVIRLRAGPKVDAIRALRAALKVLGRRFGLRAISIQAEPEGARGSNAAAELPEGQSAGRQP